MSSGKVRIMVTISFPTFDTFGPTMFWLANKANGIDIIADTNVPLYSNSYSFKHSERQSINSHICGIL